MCIKLLNDYFQTTKLVTNNILPHPLNNFFLLNY